MPRPAKPARHTGTRKKSRGAASDRARIRMKARRPRRERASLECRAGFAGRRNPLARSTEHGALASDLDPRRSLGSALYVVATPIGNLEDVTLRAIRVLREVDLVAAEDTRRTRILLQHHGIARPLTSYHDAVERERAPALVERLRRGESIALVSDAGTPGLADPGYHLVRA